MSREAVKTIDYKDLLEKHNIYPIDNWEKFDFTHGGSQVEISLIDKLKDKLQHNPSKKEPKGLYAYKKGEEWLYIGKGNPIFNRLKSHYHDSIKQQMEPMRAKRWYRFFSKHADHLTIYWIEVKKESTRKILETALHEVYKPAFNSFKMKK